MLDEQRLRNLATAEVATPAPELVIARGEQIRKRKRFASRVAVATVCLTIAAAAVIVGAAARDDRPAVELAGPAGSAEPVADEPNCGGFTEMRSPSTADAVRYLPGWLPDGLKIEYAWATADLLGRETCPRVPVALSAGRFTSASRDRIDAMIRLEGPSPTPYPSPEAPAPTSKIVSIRGTAGQLLQLSGPPSAAEITALWTEPGGGSWMLQTRYLAEADIVRIVNELKLTTGADAPPASPGWLPPGFEVTYQRQRVFTGDLPAERLRWHADAGDDTPLSIAVEQVVPDAPVISSFAAVTETRVLDVRGHQAVAVSRGPQTTLGWTEQPGVRVTIDGPYDDETLVRIAESLEPVPPDDPRIGAR